MLDSAISLALGRQGLRAPVEVMAGCAAALQSVHVELPDATTYAVTSAVPAEGRSTIAIGLSIALAASKGERTVLLDLDIDDEAVPPEGDSVPSPPADIASAIEWITEDLGVLPQDRWLPQGHRVSRHFVEAVLRDLQQLDVTVVADLPPLPPHGGGERFAGLFDAVLLVVRAGSTNADAARAAAGTLDRAPFVVLNQVRSAVPRWFPIGGRA